MASSLDTRAAGDAVGDVGTDAPQDAHDLYGFDAGVADAGVTPGTLEHLDEPGAAPGDAPSAAAEDPRGLPEDRVPEAPHKALDRIDQPGPAPRADVPSQNANTEPSPPPARETRTAEVQTDPIDDLDRYCVDLDAEAQAPGPSQNPRDVVSDSIADIAALLREARRIDLQLTRAQPRSHPSQRGSSTDEAAERIAAEMEELLAELRECRAADETTTVATATVADATAGAEDGSPDHSPSRTGPLPAATDGDSDAEYEAVQAAARALLEKRRKHERLEEIETRIRDLEAQQREVGALRLQQERLAMAGVDARAVLRAPSSKRIITAASAYLSPVDTNRQRPLPTRRRAADDRGSPAPESAKASTSRPRVSGGASPGGATSPEPGSDATGAGEGRLAASAREPSYMRPTKSVSMRGMSGRDARGDGGTAWK